ncbi:hypothetical protein U8527_13435 [Kordia algicida OT-1]|uniref:Uncharacterized protein n=1 Tax=Kordia algicida OT-1 TaxID=391587 RepID=A9E5S8_9FLAO|nr:hypothetical protein [Kordia algicida]EDP95216.1 hypothetical protein KAOT1_07022 [Kordia algicida OT-1]
MKKRSLQTLKLNKERISDLHGNALKGGETRFSCGVKCPFGPISDSMDNDCDTGCCG